MSTFAARLDVVAGNAAGMSILVEDELLIGRHADGAGQLADDQEISRSHARVTLDASGICTIEDLGSTNGTFVNGLRISAQQELSEGDKIDLGATTLVVGGLPTPALQETVSATAPQTTIPPGAQAPPAIDAAAVPSELPGEHGATPMPPTLSLQLEVDFVAREARLYLDDASEPVRLVFHAGAWRSAPAQPSEERL